MGNSELLSIIREVIVRLRMNEFDSHLLLNMLQRRYPIEYSSLLADKTDTEAHRELGKFLLDNQKKLHIVKTGEYRETINIHNVNSRPCLAHYRRHFLN